MITNISLESMLPASYRSDERERYFALETRDWLVQLDQIRSLPCSDDVRVGEVEPVRLVVWS